MTKKEFDDNLKYLEWNQVDYEDWEAFHKHKNITSDEIKKTINILEKLSIDIEEEKTINFRCAPNHFANLVACITREVRTKC